MRDSVRIQRWNINHDVAYPPKTVDANFQSAGVELFGSVFCAQGKGPHPTLLYARGFPDPLASSDILRVLRRAGYNVMSFYYRGTYGFGGVYSMQHSYEDLQAAAAFLRQESSVKTMGVDPNNIIPYGYSFGGGRLPCGWRPKIPISMPSCCRIRPICARSNR